MGESLIVFGSIPALESLRRELQAGPFVNAELSRIVADPIEPDDELPDGMDPAGQFTIMPAGGLTMSDARKWVKQVAFATGDDDEVTIKTTLAPSLRLVTH